MTTRDTADTPASAARTTRHDLDPFDRLASMVAELGAEVDRVSEELRPTEEDPPRTDEDRPSPPPPTGPGMHRGEPVDTSFAPPETAATIASTPGTPVASAAGDSPSSGPMPVAAGNSPGIPPRNQQTQERTRRTPMSRLRRDDVMSRLPAWAGAAVTLLGVVLLLVMAVQQGWIGPLGRVIGGAGLGVALLACAGRVRRSGETGRAGAFALAATGIATLYLDVLAATVLYAQLPLLVGWCAALAIAGGGLWLADRWTSQTLAVGVVLGCAGCAPLLVFSAPVSVAAAPALLAGFLVVLKVAAAPVQLRRGWPRLTAAAALPAIAAALFADAHAAVVASTPWPAVAAAVTVTITGLGLAIVTARRRPKDPVTLGLLALSGTPVLLVAPMLDRAAALGVLLGLAGVHVAVWAFRRHFPARWGAVAGATAAVAVFQASVSTLDGSARSLALLGEAVVLVMLAVRLRGKGMLLTASLYAATGAISAVAADVPPRLLVTFPAEPFVVDGVPRPGPTAIGLLTFAAVTAVSALLPWAAVRLRVLGAPGSEPLGTDGHPRVEHRLLTLVVPALPLLYGASGTVLAAVLWAAPSPTGFLVGQALVTVSWVVAAFVLLSQGIRHGALRVAGFAFIAASLAKLLLFDLAALDGFARVGAFLGAGLILLVGGTHHAKRIAERRNPLESRM
ncbi:DUF2339 domain-containing protein [Allosaccharopolyspora coralli]|uniref:DUF2339 domain-containing protein n=1 Tax=Allosaccharopolyspora coralli TaxID=2665642 RepID=A0A5Q3QB41_9PSEU|nr:DUF2339 domain-containing protein [Allosaccharopolyspora coralli]QGK71881.1 DUF2339 domain-containing protein [Allosaccharopolyspora coralli]